MPILALIILWVLFLGAIAIDATSFFEKQHVRWLSLVVYAALGALTVASSGAWDMLLSWFIIQGSIVAFCSRNLAPAILRAKLEQPVPASIPVAILFAIVGILLIAGWKANFRDYRSGRYLVTEDRLMNVRRYYLELPGQPPIPVFDHREPIIKFGHGQK